MAWHGSPRIRAEPGAWTLQVPDIIMMRYEPLSTRSHTMHTMQSAA